MPVMDDFSKIDVWALAITLINMLTLEFPFFQVNDDFENYSKFMENPMIFFQKNNVIFDSDEEESEICSLL